ncbi:hypothetical protein AM593_00590, partial [Mytilus galloprovincialis]
LEEYSFFIPVGSGICYQCHLKLPKQTISYGEGDTQELSAPISEEDDQFYNFRERHIVKGDHLHENKTVSFIDSQEKTDSEPPSINKELLLKTCVNIHDSDTLFYIRYHSTQKKNNNDCFLSSAMGITYKTPKLES